MTVVILPAGYHALGFAEGTQFVSTVKPPAILADSIDASTRELTSLIEGIQPEDSAVIQVMTTRRGSGASVLETGHRFHLIEKNDERAPDLAKAYAKEALSALINDGRIELHEIDTQQFGAVNDGLGIFISYSIPRIGIRRNRLPF